MPDIIKTTRQHKGVEGNNETENQQYRIDADNDLYLKRLWDAVFTREYD